MIGKIDAGVILGKALSPSTSIRQGESSDFHSLLKEKIGEPISLERVALELLKRIIESALLETKTDEKNLFPSSTLLLPLKPPVPKELPLHPQPVESQLNLFEIEPEFEVSNNLPGEQNFESIVREAAQRYGVEPSLIRAVIQVESGGNPLAVSKAGARGLMQLMPGTAAELGVSNAFDPAENINAGTRYLRMLLDRYRGDVKLALVAYNWGMGNLEKRPGAMPQETKNYIARVENLYQGFIKASPLV